MFAKLDSAALEAGKRRFSGSLADAIAKEMLIIADENETTPEDATKVLPVALSVFRPHFPLAPQYKPAL